MSVNKNRVRMLVDALRSGEYEQASGGLRSTKNGFCCLGVACDLASKQGQGEWVSNDLGWHYVDPTGNGSDVDLPTDIVRWYGFTRNNPLVTEPYATLASMNDGGVSFDRIADVIEKEWLS